MEDNNQKDSSGRKDGVLGSKLEDFLRAERLDSLFLLKIKGQGWQESRRAKEDPE